MNVIRISGLLIVLACLAGSGYSGLLPGGAGSRGYRYDRPSAGGGGPSVFFGGGEIGRPTTSYGAPVFGGSFVNPGVFVGQQASGENYRSAGGNRRGGFPGIIAGEGRNGRYQGGRGGGYNYNEDGGGRPQPYSFQYEVQDQPSGNDYGQQESSDGNTVRGEYRVLLPDSRTQIVRYTADDANGYNADVRYEGQAQYPRSYGGAGNGNGYQGGPNYQQGFDQGGYHGGGAGNGNGFGNDGRPNNQYLPAAGVDYGK